MCSDALGTCYLQFFNDQAAHVNRLHPGDQCVMHMCSDASGSFALQFLNDQVAHAAHLLHWKQLGMAGSVAVGAMHMCSNATRCFLCFSSTSRKLQACMPGIHESSVAIWGRESGVGWCCMCAFLFGMCAVLFGVPAPGGRDEGLTSHNAVRLQCIPRSSWSFSS